MPNANPQAVTVANGKLRPLSDKFGQLYNLCKALQAEYLAENWGALYPDDTELMVDGSETDGRAPVTNRELRTLMLNVVGPFITDFEANVALGSIPAAANAKRNLVLKIAVNPERY